MRSIPVILSLVLSSSVALAGPVVIHDEANLLTPEEEVQLQNTGSRWPFETHILTRNAHAKHLLEQAAKAAVTTPNTVAIAVDPNLRFTVVRFGIASNVKTVDFSAISDAGNPSFREGRWLSGLEAIGARAEVSTRTMAGTVAPPAPVIVREGLGWFGWAIILLGVGGLVALVIYLWRRSRANQRQFEDVLTETRLEAQELRTRNIETDAWAEGVRKSNEARRDPRPTPWGSHVSSSPAPQTASSTVVVNNGGGSGDLMTGYMLGSMSAHHHEPVRERIIEREVPARTYDSGGSSSSLDAGGSSSSWGEPSRNASVSSSSSSWGSGSSSSWGSGGSSYDSGGSSSSSDSGGSDSSW